jgi:hypothetical protein
VKRLKYVLFLSENFADENIVLYQVIAVIEYKLKHVLRKQQRCIEMFPHLGRLRKRM